MDRWAHARRGGGEAPAALGVVLGQTRCHANGWTARPGSKAVINVEGNSGTNLDYDNLLHAPASMSERQECLRGRPWRRWRWASGWPSRAHPASRPAFHAGTEVYGRHSEPRRVLLSGATVGLIGFRQPWRALSGCWSVRCRFAARPVAAVAMGSPQFGMIPASIEEVLSVSRLVRHGGVTVENRAMLTKRREPDAQGGGLVLREPGSARGL